MRWAQAGCARVERAGILRFEALLASLPEPHRHGLAPVEEMRPNEAMTLIRDSLMNLNGDLLKGLARKLNVLGEKIGDVEDMLRERLAQE